MRQAAIGSLVFAQETRLYQTQWTQSDAAAPAQQIALIALEPVDRIGHVEHWWDLRQNIGILDVHPQYIQSKYI